MKKTPKMIGKINKTPSFSEIYGQDYSNMNDSVMSKQNYSDKSQINHHVQKIKRIAKLINPSAYKDNLIDQKQQLFILKRKKKLKTDQVYSFHMPQLYKSGTDQKQNQTKYQVQNKTDIISDKDCYKIIITKSYDQSNISDCLPNGQKQYSCRNDQTLQQKVLSKNLNKSHNMKQNRRISDLKSEQSNLLDLYDLNSHQVISSKNSQIKTPQKPIKLNLKPHKQYRSHPFLDKKNSRHSKQKIQNTKEKRKINSSFYCQKQKIDVKVEPQLMINRKKSSVSINQSLNNKKRKDFPRCSSYISNASKNLKGSSRSYRTTNSSSLQTNHVLKNAKIQVSY